METFENNTYLLHRIKFSIGIVLQIPAIILSLFIFAFFIMHRTLQRNRQHQALLLLFIVNFLQLTLNIPITMDYFHLNRVSPATGSYCKWWIFIESTLDTAIELLVATISIQRHILIFQANMLRGRFKRYILYYLPLLTCVVYPVVFYMATVVFYPCDDTQWDFRKNSCGDTTCYLLHNEILATYDVAVDNGVPIIVIILANTVLVIKVIMQKYRRQQAISWSKQRRMTLQLLSISSLYVITWVPTIVVGIMQQWNSSDLLSQIQDDYVSDLSYLVCLLLPWICLGQLPEITKWVKKQFRQLTQTQNSVRPL